MKIRVVYNVKVAGHSIGLTFLRSEAEDWAKGNPRAKIIPVPYRVQ